MSFIQRQLEFAPNHSLLLFGARGVGKSALLEQLYDFSKNLYLNLLDPLEEARFTRHPSELIELEGLWPRMNTTLLSMKFKKCPHCWMWYTC